MIVGKADNSGTTYYELKAGDKSLWVSTLGLFNVQLFPQLKDRGFRFEGYNNDNEIYLDGVRLSELNVPVKEISEASLQRARVIESNVISVNDFANTINLDKMRSAISSPKEETRTQPQSQSGVLKIADTHIVNSREELIEYINSFSEFSQEMNYDYELPKLNQIANNDALFSVDEIIDAVNNNSDQDITGLLATWHDRRLYTLSQFEKYKGMEVIDFLQKMYAYGIDGIKDTCTNVEVIRGCTAPINIEYDKSIQNKCLVKSFRIMTMDQKFDNFITSEYDLAKVFNKTDKNLALVGGSESVYGKYDAVCYTYKCKLGEAKIYVSIYGIVITALNNVIFKFSPIKVNTGFHTYATIDIALDENKMSKFTKASAELVRRIQKNIVESPCNNMYDVMSYMGMTKYEKVLYTLLYFTNNKEEFREYLASIEEFEGIRTPDVSIIGQFLDGIPSYILDAFQISNSIDDIGSIIEKGLPEEEELFDYWLMLKVYYDIVNEEIPIGYTDTSSIDSIGYLAEKALCISNYEGNLDDVELDIGVLDKSYKSFVYNYYTILADRARSSKYLFIRNVIREPSFYVKAEEQRDIGMLVDYIPLGEDTSSIAKVYKSNLGGIQPVLLEVALSFGEAIKNLKANGKDKEVLIRNSYIFSYLLIKTFYYKSLQAEYKRQGQDIKVDDELFRVDKTQEGYKLICNLGKLEPVLIDAIVEVPVRDYVINTILNIVTKLKNFDLTRQDGIKLRRTYISIYDYLRLTFSRKNKGAIGNSMFICNGFVDYNKVYSTEDVVEVSSLPANKLIKSDIYARGSSACFYDDDNKMVKYLGSNSSAYVKAPNFKQELLDDLTDLMNGNTNIPGLNNITVPLVYLDELYKNDCIKSQAYLDHVRTCLDTAYSDEALDIIEYKRLEQTTPDRTGYSKEQLEVESNKKLTVTRSKELDNRIRGMSIYIKYDKIENIDAFIEYLKKPSPVNLTNTGLFIKGQDGKDTRVRYNDPELLSNYCFKVSEGTYIIRCGNLLRQIEV